MPSRGSLETIPSESELNHSPIDKCGTQLEIPELNALALRSLTTLFNEKGKLFSRSVAFDEKGVLQRQKPSPKRTMIALLGLQRLKESGESLPFDVPSICDVLLEDTSWVKSLADLGLLTWFMAECKPDRLKNLFHEFKFGSAIEDYWDGRQGQTRGLAWFLSGIAHARLAKTQALPDLTDVAVDAYHLLKDNQSEGGVFGHAARPGILQWKLCNRFGSFGDQIYAIYAMTTFAQTFHVEEPLASALNCGNVIRALQGDMGQWWSIYDKQACRVASRYPVLSLHQDGTAPVGLLTLGKATGQSFDEAVIKGLSWVAGANELEQDLINLDHPLIWDCIALKTQTLKYWEATLSMVGASYWPKAKGLKVLHEARPDHFGWLLYAFGKFGLPEATGTAKELVRLKR